MARLSGHWNQPEFLTFQIMGKRIDNHWSWKVWTYSCLKLTSWSKRWRGSSQLQDFRILCQLQTNGSMPQEKKIMAYGIQRQSKIWAQISIKGWVLLWSQYGANRSTLLLGPVLVNLWKRKWSITLLMKGRSLDHYISELGGISRAIQFNPFLNKNTPFNILNKWSSILCMKTSGDRELIIFWGSSLLGRFYPPNSLTSIHCFQLCQAG